MLMGAPNGQMGLSNTASPWTSRTNFSQHVIASHENCFFFASVALDQTLRADRFETVFSDVTCPCCRPGGRRSSCNTRSSSGSPPRLLLCRSLRSRDYSASLAVDGE